MRRLHKQHMCAHIHSAKFHKLCTYFGRTGRVGGDSLPATVKQGSQMSNLLFVMSAAIGPIRSHTGFLHLFL